jgi:polar amino acid transport system substrate-binding protein
MTARTTRRPAAARQRLAAVGTTVVAGTLLLAACGDQTDSGSKTTDSSSSSASASTAPLFDKLPEAIQKAGVIKVGSDIAYPPVEYKENGKTVGVDPDITTALAKQLGVTFEFNNGTFDTLLTGMRGGRYDIAMSAMSDTKDRQNGVDATTGKKAGEGVDFVDYFTAGVSILVKKGNPEKISSLQDLCGKNVSVQRGSVSDDLLKALKCDKAPNVQRFDTTIEGQTRLRAGGSVADVDDFPVAAYAAKATDGGNAFEVVGDQVEAGPYGIAVNKSNTQLRDALQEALNVIIKNGEYGAILKKWGVEAGAITEATINGGS